MFCERVADEIDAVGAEEVASTLDALLSLDVQYQKARRIDDGNTAQQTGSILGQMAAFDDGPVEVERWAHSRATTWKITQKAVADGGEEVVAVANTRKRTVFHTEQRCPSLQKIKDVVERPRSEIDVGHCEMCQRLESAAEGVSHPAAAPNRGIAASLYRMDVDEFDRRTRGAGL